jgi:hypothetical protein
MKGQVTWRMGYLGNAFARALVSPASLAAETGKSDSCRRLRQR